MVSPRREKAPMAWIRTSLESGLLFYIGLVGIVFGMLLPAAALADNCPDLTAQFFEEGCAESVYVIFGNGVFVDSTLCGAANDFDLGPGNGCTGQASPGPDLQVRFRISPPGAPPCELFVGLTYCNDSTPFDGAIFLLSGCEVGPMACIAASDNDGVGVGELIDTFAASPNTTYTVVVDSRGAYCGRFGLLLEMHCYGSTGTEGGSWGRIKALYR